MLNAAEEVKTFLGNKCGHKKFELGEVVTVPVGDKTLSYGPTVEFNITDQGDVKTITFVGNSLRASLGWGVTAPITSLELRPDSITAYGSKLGMAFRHKVVISMEPV